MSNKLTFTHANLSRLFGEAILLWPNGSNPSYGQAEPVAAGYWLVGDHGVYLMHNAKGQSTPATVIYAEECNPDAMEFDDWWEAKRRTFGGDDGVEYLEPDLIQIAVERGLDLTIKFSPSSFELILTKPKQKAS